MILLEKNLSILSNDHNVPIDLILLLDKVKQSFSCIQQSIHVFCLRYHYFALKYTYTIQCSLIYHALIRHRYMSFHTAVDLHSHVTNVSEQ